MTNQNSALAPRGKLFLGTQGAMFVGGPLCTEEHRHFTASVSFVLDGSIRVAKGGSSEFQVVGSLAVAPNALLSLEVIEGTVLSLQIDPESKDYPRVSSLFEGQAIQTLGPDIEAKLHACLSSELKIGIRPRELWQNLIEILACSGIKRLPRDARVEQVLRILKARYLDAPPAGELAAAVGLSEVRLVHLFSQQMGLPIRRYVLWLRLRAVAYWLGAGCSLTEAAHAAGFADSAHMSRTFRGMFGLAPSALLCSNRELAVEFVLPQTPEEVGPHFEFDLERLQRLQEVHGDASSSWTTDIQRPVSYAR
jgi:AraC-like DNA-binding protein